MCASLRTSHLDSSSGFWSGGSSRWLGSALTWHTGNYLGRSRPRLQHPDPYRRACHNACRPHTRHIPDAGPVSPEARDVSSRDVPLCRSPHARRGTSRRDGSPRPVTASRASALASIVCGRRCDTPGARTGHPGAAHGTPAGHHMRTACCRVKVVSSRCPYGPPEMTSGGTVAARRAVPHPDHALREVLHYSPSWMAGPKPGHGVEAGH
jgi:hypothetical protein